MSNNDLSESTIDSFFSNQYFKNQLQHFYQSLLHLDPIKESISSIVKETLELTDQSQHSITTNSQKLTKSDPENIFPITNQKDVQIEEQEQCLVEVQSVTKEVTELFEKEMGLIINRELFEVEQAISSKVMIEIEDFKEEQLKIVESLRKQIEELRQKQHSNFKLLNEKSKNNSQELLKQNSVQKLNKRSSAQEQMNLKRKILNNRKLLTSQLLQYSRIQQKNHYDNNQNDSQSLSSKKIPDAISPIHKQKQERNGVGSCSNILNDENFDEGESSSSQLQIESKICEISEQSQKWLRQANKWYLHALSKVQKLQVNIYDIKGELLDKIETSFSGVWNVLTDLQQKMNQMSKDNNKRRK